MRSARGAFYTYARTRDGIPEIVTATGTSYTEYTTLPDWWVSFLACVAKKRTRVTLATELLLTFQNRYTAMPPDALKVFESVRKEEDKIWSSVVPKAAKTSGSQGAAPQATGIGLYANGAIAAVIGAVAVAL